MKQLTFRDIIGFAAILKKQGMDNDEILSLPVYLGDDDELNGIHCCWYTNLIDVNNPNDENLVEMINESRGNIKIKGKALLIS